MILSDTDIKKALKDKRIRIFPPPSDDQYDTSSLNLRLSQEFKEWDPNLFSPKSAEIHLDFSNVNLRELSSYLKPLREQEDGSVILKPKQFILATTLERIHLPRPSRIAARVEGRSTAARLGFVAHLSAPTIHLGFEGVITLEIINFGPFHIKLDPKKDRICQVIFEEVSDSSDAPSSQYQGQRKVTGS